MADTIDALQLEISSSSQQAEAGIDRLISALDHLDSSLANAGRTGARSFQSSIASAMSSLQELAELANVPIKLNIQAESGDPIGKMRSSLEQALSDTKLDTSKIASRLTENFNITGKRAAKNIDSQLQSIVENFVDSFDGGALKLSRSALNGLVDSISQSAKIAQSELSGAFDGIEQEYKEFYDYFKNKKIYISDLLKNDIGKSEFKNALETNLSNITRNAGKGVDLNSVWEELSRKFPTIISPDTVNAANQVLEVLQKINEARDRIKPVSVQMLFGNDYDAAIKNIQDTALNAVKEAKENLVNRTDEIFSGTGSKINLDIVINEDKIVHDIESAVRKASKVKYNPVSVNLDVDTTKIKNTVSEKLKGLEVGNIPQLSAGIKQISDSMLSMSGINLKDTGINNVINAITRLNNTAGTITSGALSVVSSEISNLAKSLNDLNGIQFDASGIGNIANAIAMLGRKNISTAAQNIPFLTMGLKDFVNEMNGLGSVSFDVSGLSELVSAISKLGNKNALAAPGNIEKLAVSLKQMMTTLSTAPKISQSLVQMTQAMAQLASNGNQVSNMSAGVSSGFHRIGSTAPKAKKNVLSLAAAFGKFYATYWLLLRGLSQFKKAIDISSDLTEVQNVVDVTFGDMKQKAEDLASTSIQDFGMSELTAKQISSRFQAMGMAMGFAQDKMSDMSINLTKLTADMASFYNVEQEAVAKSLQSVFTGETEPLRRYGLDLTNATLQAWALAQGLDVNVQKMSQMEKTALRYRYVMANTAAAQGDFARTSDTWHNSLVRLSQSFQQLGGIVGGVLINAFKPFISALNSAMQSVITFAKTVANALGAIFGWTIEINSGGLANDFEAAGDGADEMESGTGGAAKNLKDMNKYIAAWHEVNNMTTDDDAGGGGGGGGGGGAAGGLGDAAEAQFKRTEGLLDKFRSEIDNLYDLGKYIGESLANALNSIDWDKIYQTARHFGTGLAEFLNGLISPELFEALGNTIAGAINTAIYTALSFGKAFDFSNLGISIAAGINAALGGIDWGSALDAAREWGSGIAKTINGFMKKADFRLVGETVANGLNTAIEYALSFGAELDWNAVGKSIASSINGFFDSFNFKGLAETLNTWATGILDAAIEAIERTRWVDIGAKIGEFIADINFLEIGAKVGRLLWDAISAGIGAMAGAFSAAPIETTLMTVLGALVIAPNVIGGINDAIFAVGRLRSEFSLLKSMALADPMLAIAAAIGAIAAALYAFGKNWEAKKAEEFIQFQKDIGSNTSDLRVAADNLREVSDRTRYLVDNADQDAERLGKLADSYFELADKSSLTSQEQKNLQKYAKELTDQIPLLGNSIDTVTGKYTAQKDEIYKLIEAQQAQMQVDAYQKVMEKYSDAIAETNVELAIAEENYKQNAATLDEYSKALDHISDTGLDQWAKDHEKLLKEVGITYQEGVTGIDELRTAYENYSIEVEQSAEAIEYAQNAVDHATRMYDVANDKMQEQSQRYDELIEGSAEYQQALQNLKTDFDNFNVNLSDAFVIDLTKQNFDTSGLKQYFASIEEGVSASSLELQRIFGNMGLSLSQKLADGLAEKDADVQASAVRIIMSIQSGVQATKPQLDSLLNDLGISIPGNLIKNLSSQSAPLQSATIELLASIQAGYNLTAQSLEQLFSGLGLTLPTQMIASMEKMDAPTQQATIELLGQIAAGYDGTAEELLLEFEQLGLDLPGGLKEALQSENENVRNQTVELLGQLLSAEESERGPIIERLRQLGIDLDVEGLSAGMESGKGEVEATARGVANAAGNALSDEMRNVISKAKQAGVDFTGAFAASIASGTGSVNSAVGMMATTAITTLKNKKNLDEHSPSKKTKKIGADFIAGFNEGIEEEVGGTYSLINDYAKSIMNGFDFQIPTLDMSVPSLDLEPKSFDVSGLKSTMQMEIDTKMASLDFQNQQLQSSIEENTSVLQEILARGIVLDDNNFTKRYERSARAYRRRTGAQLGVAF